MHHRLMRAPVVAMRHSTTPLPHVRKRARGVRDFLFLMAALSLMGGSLYGIVAVGLWIAAKSAQLGF